RRRRDYDIVHFHGASIPLLTSALLLKLMGKKIVAKVSSSGLGIEAGSFKGRYSILGKIFISILKRVDAFVAISSTIESALISEGYPQGRIHRISNFVDMTVFKNSKASADKRLGSSKENTEEKTVVFSGALIDTKGVDVLLKAWQKVSESFSEARLSILGKGHDEEKLKALAEELQLNNVEFTGEVDDVPRRLQRADIGVLPSFHEGMPNSLLEAMGSGLPVVATRISGVIDAVNDGVNGFIVTPGSVEELAEALVKLLKDDLLLGKMGSEALNTICDNYSLEATTPKYISLYERLTSKKTEKSL
ncbi:MAG: glycosyltransferase family 4 protein, partial [Deltaproteobacteria bacterium]|nr:glycosyltransferase family 4 protein [Deltaproteobacteria bacterium]